MIPVALPVDYTTHLSKTADATLKQGKGFLFHPYPRDIVYKLCISIRIFIWRNMIACLLILFCFSLHQIFNKESYLQFLWICHVNFIWELRGTVTKWLTFFLLSQALHDFAKISKWVLGTFHTPQHFLKCGLDLILYIFFVTAASKIHNLHLIELILLLFVWSWVVVVDGHWSIH